MARKDANENATQRENDQITASCAVDTNSGAVLPVSSLENPAYKKTEPAEHLDNLVDGYGREFSVPDFSVNDIRKAIPPECFDRSAFWGLAYVVRDLILLSATFYIFEHLINVSAIQYTYLRFSLWSLYGFLNGLFGTGLWVLAHECGHQALSTSKILNDTVGFILHSALLVPYFSWKISHGKHHKATAHMERDMVFVPRTRKEHCERFRIPTQELHELVEDTPLYAAFYVSTRLLFGWPTYLLTNDTGHDCHERQPEGRGKGKRNGPLQGVNHFNPSSPLFESKDAKLIFLSDVGLLIALAALGYVGYSYGWLNLWRWYGVPYLWVNSWLVSITLLQHTDPSLPHYTADTWNYVRGAAATIDRDFGFIGRHIFHRIIEDHVVHHYVSTIPFYRAEKATRAIKPVMGVHYRAETDGGALGFLTCLWRNVKMCRWVEPAAEATGNSRGVLFYRNSNGYGPAPQRIV